MSHSATRGRADRNVRGPVAATITVVLLFLLGVTTAHAQPVFDARHVGGIGSGKDSELARPAGPGPFPAIVVMHGCNGVAPHYRAWTETLRSWGYVAMLVNSFSSRGKTNVCN